MYQWRKLNPYNNAIKFFDWTSLSLQRSVSGLSSSLAWMATSNSKSHLWRLDHKQNTTERELLLYLTPQSPIWSCKVTNIYTLAVYYYVFYQSWSMPICTENVGPTFMDISKITYLTSVSPGSENTIMFFAKLMLEYWRVHGSKW